MLQKGVASSRRARSGSTTHGTGAEAWLSGTTERSPSCLGAGLTELWRSGQRCRDSSAHRRRAQRRRFCGDGCGRRRGRLRGGVRGIATRTKQRCCAGGGHGRMQCSSESERPVVHTEHGQKAGVQKTVSVVVGAQRAHGGTLRRVGRVEKRLQKRCVQMICLQEIGAQVRAYLRVVLLQRGKNQCGSAQEMSPASGRRCRGC
mmetsp:Transcript_2919/g.7123  ORF Transcript_2919/g.7123 Transcript_2919/m.7123 type:complete len:203 (+) Transcript_2919:1166-1774(+)